MQDIKVAVDAVVFGYDPEEGISVLLIRRKNHPYQKFWAIPGGLVSDDESLEDAVRRELAEETGIDVGYMEQLYTFGHPDRDPRNRVISVAYYCLVRPGDFKLSANSDAEDVAWFNTRAIPELAFDHATILEFARKRLRGKIAYEPVGFELLEKEFPFSDLERLYQVLLDKELDRRNFKKKIMSYGFLEATKKNVQRGAGRPARLFRFNRKKYFSLRERGYNFDLFI